MADARLRELARWEQADLEAQVRLLRERMRAGELSERRVRLAAYCRNEPAVVVLGVGAPEVPERGGEWCKGLFPWDKEAGVRAAVAVALEVLTRLAAPLPEYSSAELLALQAALDWLRNRSDKTRRRASRGLENHRGAFATEHALRAAARKDSTELQKAKASMGAAEDAAKAFSSVFHGDMARKVSFRADFRHDPEREEAVRSALPGRPVLLLTIQSSLAHWALGLHDHVAEPVAAREDR